MTIIDIIADKDAYVDIDNPGTNYGSSNDLEVGHFVTPPYDITKYSYYEFDLSSIPSDATISSAVLYFYVYSIDSNNDNSLYRFQFLSQQFNEATITWNNRPSLSPAWSGSFSASSVGWNTATLYAPFVNSSISTGYVGIQHFDVDADSALIIRSTEYGSLEPYLKITYTAPPHRYVKTGGNDANDGTSWDDADAWATVDKAATTVVDGTVVHIGFGTYNSEPANNKIAPVNAGSSGIKYLPETETTCGGTGSVIVEVN